jgi:RES domain-containing protein
MAESLAHVRYYSLPESKALPRTLVALNVKVRKALDLRAGNLRSALRLAEGTIRHFDWRALNQKGEEALTQAWGQTFAAAGYEVVIVPSAADPKGTNVLVFPGNLTDGSVFSLDKDVEWPAK